MSDPALITAHVDRIPPNSLDAEMAVIGASILDADAFSVASEHLTAGDFHSLSNAAVWDAVRSLYSRGLGVVDKVAVAEALRAAGQFEKLGGMIYLTSLLDAVTTLDTTEYHAKIVAEKAMLRRLIAAGSSISRIGYDGEADATGAIADAESALAAVVSSERTGPLETVYQVMERLEAARKAGRNEAVFYSPWANLNHALGGFMAGELIAWVAAPQIGKSGVVSMLADYTAEKYGAVILAALENGVDRTVQRLLALRTGISARAQRIGALSPDQRSQLELASYDYAMRPFYVVGVQDAGSIAKMIRLCRKVSRDGRLATVIVDHASKLEDVSREQGRLSKHERLSAAYERLIELAHQFRCPVHVVQHFNRDGHTASEPTIASLGKIRDGGNLEGHADAIIMPHRENPIGTDIEKETGKFVIAKSRDGVGGEVHMRYDGARNMWLQADSDGRPWFEMAVPV